MSRDQFQIRLGRIEAEFAERLLLVEGENAGLKVRVAELVAELEKARRAGKRQAAPFSKGEPRPGPARPGRKAGPAHGTPARRTPPPEVDQVIAVALPEACPGCGGALRLSGTSEQHQIELPLVLPRVTRYVLERGRCTGCGRPALARHSEQTSDAVGAAGVMLGPRAVAAGALLHHELGLSWEMVARLAENDVAGHSCPAPRGHPRP